MPVKLFIRDLNRARRSLGALAADTRGAAAVEFAFLLPLLTLMLLGTMELGRAINMDREFTMATGMTGDLVAREQFLGTSSTDAKNTLDSMMASIQHIMQPYDSSSLALGIFSVQASATNASDTRVVWSYSWNGKTVPSKCATYALPSGMLAKGGSTVVVEFKLPLQAALRKRHSGPVHHDLDRQVLS